MERIDVLGDRPERRPAFRRELLAETTDAELQEIVTTAARELSSPIALVSLVLDQIQFFKAHYGLPPDLAAARGTDRDVSFCQFVVRDGDTFEVNDAPNDPRVPQHLVDAYDIRAYLGAPIHAEGTVVGSLCVLDTRSRSFSEDQRVSLEKLAGLVDQRLAALNERRREVRAALTEQASAPALAELRESLAPMRRGVEGILPAAAAVRSFLRLCAHVLEGGAALPDVVRRSRAAAADAAEAIEEAAYDILAAAGDCEDDLSALEQLTTTARVARLSEIVMAAQDLARRSTRPVGGAPLPDLGFDPLVRTPRPLAVGVLTTALVAVADRLAADARTPGIRLAVRSLAAHAELGIAAEGLSAEAVREISAELAAKIGIDPAVSILHGDGAVRVRLAVVAA